MALRAKIQRDKPNVMYSYPCLKESMDYPGRVVLFTAPKEGIVVSEWEGGVHKIGRESKLWSESVFKLFEGSIVLSNK